MVNVLLVEKIGTVSPVRADWQVRQRLSVHLKNPFFFFAVNTFELTKMSLRFLGRLKETIGQCGIAAKHRFDECKIGKYFCSIWGRLGRPGLKEVTKGTLLDFLVLELSLRIKLSGLVIFRILSKAASIIFGLYCRRKRYCRSSSRRLVKKESVEQIRRSL